MKEIFLLATALLTGAALQAENWPCFRGPTRQGVSAETKMPLHWNATSNVVWKIPIPGESWSSPIVWGDRVFVTTATEKGTSCCVLCLDRKAGKALWNREAFQQQPGHKNNCNSYATPTPCTDGAQVYAVFGDGSLSAVSMTPSTATNCRSTPPRRTC